MSAEREPVEAAAAETAQPEVLAGAVGPIPGGMAAAVLRLQRTAGNRATAAMLAGGGGRLPPPGGRAVAQAARQLQRAPIAPTGDIEEWPAPGVSSADARKAAADLEEAARKKGAATPGGFTPSWATDPASQEGWKGIPVTKMTDDELKLVNDVMAAPDVVAGRSMNVKGRGMLVLDTWLDDNGIKWSQRWQDVYNKALYLRTADGKPVKVLSGAGYTAGEANAAEAGAAASGIKNIPYWPDPKAPQNLATTDPLAAAKFHTPGLVNDYNQARAVYDDLAPKLQTLEDNEKLKKSVGVPLTPDEEAVKKDLKARVAAASAQMKQAQKDYDLITQPGASNKDLQELITRRGIPTAVAKQTDATGAAALQGTGISGWNLSDQGLAKKSGTSTSQTRLDENGKPFTVTNEDYDSTTLGGTGTYKGTKGTRTTVTKPDGSIQTDDSTTKSVDLTKLEASKSSSSSVITTDAAGTATKKTDSTSTSVGATGITQSKTDSTQVGDQLDSKTNTKGVVWGQGQLGVSAGSTTKKGTMTGPPGEEKMDKGVEQTNKVTGGIVADEKGTGLGLGGTSDTKRYHGDGVTTGLTGAAGGKFQTLVEEIPGSDPPSFTIKTTISFDIAAGASAGKEQVAKPDANNPGDSGVKASATGSINVNVGRYASFKRVMKGAEAETYIAFVKANGRGSTLPEHKLLATGVNSDWGAAWKAWRAMNGSPELLKSLGDEGSVETNSDTGAGGSLGASGGDSGSGGLSVGGSVTAKGSHKVNVQSAVLKGGKVQITALVYDEAEAGGSGTVSMGAASGTVGHTGSAGSGRTYVFVLDKADPQFDAAVIAINSAGSAEDLDRVASTYKQFVGSRTDTTTEGKGDTVGVGVGPLSLDMGGKAKHTEDVTRDAQGRVTSTRSTGENTTGGTVGVGKLKVGDSETDTVAGQVEVDPDGTQHATGKLEKKTTATSWGKTKDAVMKAATQDPLKLITSPGTLVKDETTSDKTTLAAQGAYDHLVYEAWDEHAWMGHVASPNKRDDWRACMYAIRKASKQPVGGEPPVYDATAVQAALAKWNTDTGGSRLTAVEAVMRPGASGELAVQAAFPGSLATYEKDFQRYVLRSAVDDSKAVAEFERQYRKLFSKDGDAAAFKASVSSARNELNDALSHLQPMAKAVHDGGAELGDPAMQSEMLTAINSKISQVNTKLHRLQDAETSYLKELEVTAEDAADTAQDDKKMSKQAKATAAKALADAKQQVEASESAEKATVAKQKEQEAHGNFDAMWTYNSSINAKCDAIERLLGDSSFFGGSGLTRHSDEIGKLCNEIRAVIRQWKDKQAINQELIKTYGNEGWAWLAGPPVKPAEDRFDATYRKTT
jgi:hypothetical protein